MENQNPKIDERLTTKSLGIADSKEEDLGGYVLSQRDIQSATTKILMSVGIKQDDIRTIKVGSDKDSNLRIICEVKYKAAFAKSNSNENTSWYSFTDGSDEEYSNNFKNAFNKNFYAALHNKVYHGKRKHLNLKVVRRPDPNSRNDTKKYVSFELDPSILIAFVYDIVFTDPFYKISAPQIRWMSEKKINDMSGKERKKYRAKQKELKDVGLCNCAIYVTFAKKASWTFERDGKKTTITGFHPAQVDEFYDDENDD